MEHLNFADALAIIGVAFAFCWVMREFCKDE